MAKGITLTLGDGNAYVMPPLTLGALEDFQDGIAAMEQGGLDKETIATTIDVALASLKRNYPEMTRDMVRELIDLEIMAEVFEAVMDVSGLRRKAIEAGEATGASL
ncbi:hypothetical protein [Sphingomonas sp. HMP6]|uniref:hypothetical protein n=1 Tax=Sphingomonas sp. HMP6 TaxID=1517551 RepID=UPI00159642E3|nr:hypothetical protein [Sphingomonas sp. HMP6]BCA57683.1 hypothetical protein HMP06_0452 [Sphingomonas sp. HMP6]